MNVSPADADHTTTVVPRISDKGARVAAGKLRITVEEYRQHETAGEAWCSRHGDWHSVEAFGPSEHRSTGLEAVCRERNADDVARFFLTPEGAAVVTAAVSLADSDAGELVRQDGIPPTAASSGHRFCPAVLGCREGRLPAGWIRAEVAS